MKIKTRDELVAVAGERFSSILIKLRKPSWTKYPYSVTFASKKPKFGLDDGGMLFCYLVDLHTMTVLADHYCGSSDSVINHAREQLSEGNTPPEGFGYLFIETTYNGRNQSWFVTMVTSGPKEITV